MTYQPTYLNPSAVMTWAQIQARPEKLIRRCGFATALKYAWTGCPSCGRPWQKKEG
jgi:lipopolysaccharide biosynthesis regulator YciM